MLRVRPIHYLSTALLSVLTSCGSASLTTRPELSETDRSDAIKTLNEAIRPAVGAKITTSTEIDWFTGVLPWDRFTLPLISPNGLHAAVQLGTTPSMHSLCCTNNLPIDSTAIELHILDPIQGRRISPLHIGMEGLILSQTANDQVALVEFPNGEFGRSIGQIEWATGNITWLVENEQVNAFPTMNGEGDLAWSQKSLSKNRFYLAIKNARGLRRIDDGESDWVLPKFLGNDKLRVFKINSGKLSLVELDLRARDPLLTAISLPIVEEGATRNLAWQVATTNQNAYWHSTHAFYHPIFHRMVVWNPNQAEEVVMLVHGSIAATPAIDESWLVATDNRIVRQKLGDEEGIRLRNNFAIPIATTSKQWTHLLLIPDGNRLQVRALNLDD